jgi:hypothetical protein
MAISYYYFRKNYDSFGKEIYFSYKIYLKINLFCVLFIKDIF